MKKLLVAFTLLVTVPSWSALAKPAAKPSALKWSPIDAKGSGAQVTALQYLLRYRGVFKGKADGKFNAQTMAAIKAFQKSKKLKVDGVAGPQTLSNLVPLLKVGDEGDAVRAVQTLARDVKDHAGHKPNAALKVDGDFGKGTAKAIMVAQDSFNSPKKQLAVDGVVGPRTWFFLLGGKVMH